MDFLDKPEFEPKCCFRVNEIADSCGMETLQSRLKPLYLVRSAESFAIQSFFGKIVKSGQKFRDKPVFYSVVHHWCRKVDRYWHRFSAYAEHICESLCYPLFPNRLDPSKLYVDKIKRLKSTGLRGWSWQWFLEEVTVLLKMVWSASPTVRYGRENRTLWAALSLYLSNLKHGTSRNRGF